MVKYGPLIRLCTMEQKLKQGNILYFIFCSYKQLQSPVFVVDLPSRLVGDLVIIVLYTHQLVLL